MSFIHRSFSFDENSVDEAQRTARIVWSTGAPVKRNNWATTPVLEELDMSIEAINLELLNDKAPLLMDHNSGSIRNIVGYVVPGSAYISDKKGYATIRFGTDPDSDVIFQKVKEGLVSKISVGYSVESTKKIRSQNKDQYDTILVTKWTPREVSLVVFPADPHSGIRLLEEEPFQLKDVMEDVNDMSSQTESKLKTEERKIPMNLNEGIVESKKEMETRQESKALDVREIVKRERERINEIGRMVRLAHLDESFSRQLIESDVSLEAARAEIFQKMEDSQTETRFIPTVSGGNPVETVTKRNDAIAQALLHRYNPQAPLDESSARFRYSSLVDIARHIVGGDQFESACAIIGRAMSTSDFPNLLKDVVNKSLINGFAEAPRTYEPLVRKVTTRDFKKIHRVQMGDAPVFKEKAENGQYQAGSFSDASESYSIKEFGTLITISRQTLINDDLGAMLRIPSMIARRAAELESDLVWAEILNNPVMGDGNKLFDKVHSNIATVSSGITVQSIADAKRSMRMQRGLNGARLNITPYYLIVPSSLEMQALQFMMPTTPNVDQSTNPYKTSLRLIVEPRLDDVSPSAWYLAADLGQIDLIEMAYLQGQEGLFVDQKYSFDSDNLIMKARLDAGAKVIDFRGFFRNDGEKSSSK